LSVYCRLYNMANIYYELQHLSSSVFSSLAAKYHR